MSDRASRVGWVTAARFSALGLGLLQALLCVGASYYVWQYLRQSDNPIRHELLYGTAMLLSFGCFLSLPSLVCAWLSRSRSTVVERTAVLFLACATPVGLAVLLALM